jgi:hypothetical protein
VYPWFDQLVPFCRIEQAKPGARLVRMACTPPGFAPPILGSNLTGSHGGAGTGGLNKTVYGLIIWDTRLQSVHEGLEHWFPSSAGVMCSLYLGATSSYEWGNVRSCGCRHDKLGLFSAAPCYAMDTPEHSRQEVMESLVGCYRCNSPYCRATKRHGCASCWELGYTVPSTYYCLSGSFGANASRRGT